MGSQLSSQSKQGLGGLGLYVPEVGKRIEEMLAAPVKKAKEGEGKKKKAVKDGRPESPPALVSGPPLKKV